MGPDSQLRTLRAQESKSHSGKCGRQRQAMAGYTSVYVCLKMVEGLHGVRPEIGKES